MTYAFDNVKKVVVLGTAVFAVAAIPALLSRDTSFDLGVITSAQAQEDHAASKKGTGAGNKGPGAGQGVGTGKANGGTAQGSKSVESLLKGSSTSAKGQGGPSADSDRPPTAGIKGGKGGGGGKPVGGGTKKGDQLGDIFVLIRNPVTGAAILDAAGLPLVQAYTKDAAGNLVLLPGQSIPRDAEGNLFDHACGRHPGVLERSRIRPPERRSFAGQGAGQIDGRGAEEAGCCRCQPDG